MSICDPTNLKTTNMTYYSLKSYNLSQNNTYRILSPNISALLIP